MFSGIIQSVGKISSIQPKAAGFLISIVDPLTVSRLTIGSSVSVSGVCLTTKEFDDTTVIFEVMPETLRKTTLGLKNIGDFVDLENSLRIGDELGGHFVSGHIDGVAYIIALEQEGDAWLMTIKPPFELMKFMIDRGSIAVDGVSLTIARLNQDSFMVSLIEYTWTHTTLGLLKPDDNVNIECDMLLKFVSSKIQPYNN